MLNKELLYKTIEKFEICLDDEAFSRLDTFAEMLIETNKSFNLTAIKEPNDVTVKHFADCLSIFKYVCDQSRIRRGFCPDMTAFLVPLVRFLTTASLIRETLSENPVLFVEIAYLMELPGTDPEIPPVTTSSSESFMLIFIMFSISSLLISNSQKL